MPKNHLSVCGGVGNPGKLLSMPAEGGNLSLTNKSVESECKRLRVAFARLSGLDIDAGHTL